MLLRMFSSVEDVQCCGGCLVVWRMFNYVENVQ